VPESNSTPFHWKPVAFPSPVTLRGGYVTLEPVNAARHGESLWQAIKDHDELWTWLAQGPFPGAAEMMAGLEQWRADNRAVLLAIVPAETGKAAGWASYMRIKPANGVIEVGNVMFSPALRRTRAATQAMFLMAKHVFEDLGYRRYEWKCNAENAASRRAALRLGFTFEGIFRQHMVVKDRNRDTAWFSMLDSEWPARKRAFEAWLAPGNFDAVGHQRKSLGQLLASGHEPSAVKL
jgi:RimJ/RimL family protein N-acetyltransferase